MISVIMSVYNENPLDLKKCIESILTQTYQNFEFIIVNDNPKNIVLEQIILSYMQSDERIRYLKNDENLGLALSLNKAVKIAKGDFLFRMDADDISYPSRMQKEIDCMQNKSLDLVCSGYDIIDENSKITKENVGFIKDKSMRTSIPYQVSIHHPTVMMRKDAFESIGGYRNFICAQDYDLWLRMWNENYNMQIINEALLMYRVHSKSTTTTKKYAQKCTIDYIKRLFWQRLKFGRDDYTYASYNDWLKKQGAFDKRKKEKFMKEHEILSKANMYKEKGRILSALIMRIYIFFKSSNYRTSYLGHYKTKFYLNKYANNKR